MVKSVSPDAISVIMSNPSPDSSSSDFPEIVVQVLDLQLTENSRFRFVANDGKMKLDGMFPSSLSNEVNSENIQNLGLIRILDYTLNDIPLKNKKYMIVTKCEVVSSPLEAEIIDVVKSEDTGILLTPKHDAYVNNVQGLGIILKPKQEMFTKSAAQIVHKQTGNMASSATDGNDTESSSTCFFESISSPMASVGTGLSPSSKSGGRSLYADRVSLSYITSNPSLGEEKRVFFSTKGYISFIKPDQSMWYRACKTCNKKVTEAIGSGFRCEECQKNDDECNLRYIMAARFDLIQEGRDHGDIGSLVVTSILTGVIFIWLVPFVGCALLWVIEAERSLY